MAFSGPFNVATRNGTRAARIPANLNLPVSHTVAGVTVTSRMTSARTNTGNGKVSVPLIHTISGLRFCFTHATSTSTLARGIGMAGVRVSKGAFPARDCIFPSRRSCTATSTGGTTADGGCKAPSCIPALLGLSNMGGAKVGTMTSPLACGHSRGARATRACVSHVGGRVNKRGLDCLHRAGGPVANGVCCRLTSNNDMGSQKFAVPSDNGTVHGQRLMICNCFLRNKTLYLS